jgi:hypothetical protein
LPHYPWCANYVPASESLRRFRTSAVCHELQCLCGTGCFWRIFVNRRPTLTLPRLDSKWLEKQRNYRFLEDLIGLYRDPTCSLNTLFYSKTCNGIDGVNVGLLRRQDAMYGPNHNESMFRRRQWVKRTSARYGTDGLDWRSRAHKLALSFNPSAARYYGLVSRDFRCSIHRAIRARAPRPGRNLWNRTLLIHLNVAVPVSHHYSNHGRAHRQRDHRGGGQGPGKMGLLPEAIERSKT